MHGIRGQLVVSIAYMTDNGWQPVSIFSANFILLLTKMICQ